MAGLARPPTRATRVRCSTQLPGRFASVGTSRFFAPRRSRSSWEPRGVVYSFFTRSRDTTSRRDASCYRSVSQSEGEARERGAETCARMCPSFVRSHVDVVWCSTAGERRTEVDRSRRAGDLSLVIHGNSCELVRANIASTCATQPNTEKVWSASVSKTRWSWRYLIDNDCQVGASRYDHSRDACLEVSFAKKSCRPDDRQVSACFHAQLCSCVMVQRFQESSDLNVCAPSENRVAADSKGARTRRADYVSTCDVLLSA